MDCCHEKDIKGNQGDEETLYTCPMHPEVVQDTPGMCPECGMQLVPGGVRKNEEHHTGSHTNIFKRKFWVSLVLTIPVLIYSDLALNILNIEAPTFPGSAYVGPVFGTIVFFYGGWIFLTSAWREIRGRLPGMMTLIAIAIIAAYVFSMAVSIFASGEGVLFWELTSLITIMLLGHWLEMRAVRGAQGALNELAKLLPDTAELIEGTQTRMIPLAELRVGNHVLVRPGAKIPADGTITKGQSTLNEAVITGESRPVEKGADDQVIAGTTNGDGSLTVRVDMIGDDTFLAGVMRLVSRAQASKSRLQILSDRAALYLTAVALIVGVVAFGSWVFFGYGLVVAVTRLVAVLVISCPHALGLAVPLVASISTTKAAQNGFLIKERLSLEAARNIDVVLFDKTGTLTEGAFGVAHIVASEGTTVTEVLSHAAALNSHSEHPLAQATVAKARSQNIEIPEVVDFKRIPGKGVEGSVGGARIVLGNALLLNEATIPREQEHELASYVDRGNTIVHLVVDGTYQGSIAFADRIREESKEAIAVLKNAGISSAMITGDTADVAKWVAKDLGIEEYFASVLPGEKAEKVQELQRRGLRVAMVGDGVNDAPALTQADLGIAIGAGTNVAIESAGIILVRNDPRDIGKIVTLSRLTYRKMIQNLWWAAGYNIVAIPLAAGVLAPVGIVLQPAAGAVLMSLSTLIVALNALLLRKQVL
ncbi:MAG: copper-translocating P-type ATPase [bacterium]|nr:copper-translocating P-type ATPase [bacterium]